MEDVGTLQAFVIDIRGTEGIVCPAAVKDEALLTRGADHYRVRGRLTRVYPQAASKPLPILLDSLAHQVAKGVRADTGHQAHRHAQPVQTQPGVRDRSPGTKRCRAHCNQTARVEGFFKVALPQVI
jgi:hypothetical protein